jgi:hypothetical protein
MLNPEGRALRDELVHLMEAGADSELEDARFDELARRVFAYNYHHVPAYAGYSMARGHTPDTVRTWSEIPAVPTAAFQDLEIMARGATAEAIFVTSGTTGGPERRGAHHVPDLSLYRASLRATFATFLLPDDALLPCLSLVPPAHGRLAGSSLAVMVEDVQSHFGAHGTATFADRDGIDFDLLDEAVARNAARGRPVMLLGTSSAFIHWLDRLAASGVRHTLPDGSRLMDTGGFKGRGRQVEPEDLRQAYHDLLGLPAGQCVNEYGMTEMLSQLYDTTLRDRYLGRAGHGRKRGPPWLRSVAVDPETLDPLPSGQSGLLRHVDLANIGSVAAIQTQDLGRVDEHGLVLEGRLAGAPPRGCSMAMELLLEGRP